MEAELTNAFSVMVHEIQTTRDRFVNDVWRFAETRIRTGEKMDGFRRSLFDYIVAMILFLWRQKHQDLFVVLDGLHNQTISSVHAYLCPDVVPPKMQTSVQDPYEAATRDLQRLSAAKPQTCKFCKRESIFAFTSVQRRSADEGMTTYTTCSLCGKQQRG